MPASPSLVVANCSGFYGDRLAAAREMVEGGPIDVLTGDWLAELTMLILAKGRARQGGGGWARTFVTQMEQVMGTCLDRGIKVVANAGGLDPAGCARAVEEVGERLGLHPVVAHVLGDDVLDRLDAFRDAGHRLEHLDTGEPFGDRQAVTANAYLGCWGIAEALARGADIVITGRTTDAAIVMGPAAWRFGWRRDDWDALAGACVAGHIVECGCQATGGNYPWFTEVPGLEHPGFPIAEIGPDGTSVITKHPGTGGMVTVGTVTAQLLYEIGGPRYLNPDVVARFDTIHLEQVGRDRVAVSGVRGEAAPATLKLSLNYEGGYRNSVTFRLTGLDIEAKADLVQRTFWGTFPGGASGFDFADATLVRSDKADPPSNEEAVAELILSVRDADPRKVGRAFSNVATEMALSSYPGLFGRDGPSDGRAFGVHWPALLPSELCHSEVVVGGRTTVVDNTTGGVAPEVTVPAPDLPGVPAGPSTSAPLGRIMGGRSGDKGGNANLGVWVRTPLAYAWLREFLTVSRLEALFPEAAAHRVVRSELPNLLALNFVFTGLLDEGVASSTRMDAQAKGLAEYVRARLVAVPDVLLAEASAG